jgi:hypothetical protein
MVSFFEAFLLMQKPVRRDASVSSSARRLERADHVPIPPGRERVVREERKQTSEHGTQTYGISCCVRACSFPPFVSLRDTSESSGCCANLTTKSEISSQIVTLNNAYAVWETVPRIRPTSFQNSGFDISPWSASIACHISLSRF